MEAYSTLSSIFTVISFFAFAGIVGWAWSARRKPSFDAAAIEPFALPDEASVWDRGGSPHSRPGAAASSVISSTGARP